MWGTLSYEEVALLTSARIDDRRASPDTTVPRSLLPNLYPQTAPHLPRPYPAEDLPGTTPRTADGKWDFKDENLATHLIRNGLGRGDEWERRHVMSIKGPASRSFKDDTSVV